MRAVFAQIASISTLVFAVSSMLSVGLAYRIGQILRPLADSRAVFRVVVANFVLVPLLAVGIERVIPMEPALALGFFLLAGSAGAPFLIKLASAARSDLALSAALLMILVPGTVFFLPFYLPIALAHPSLRDLAYARSSVFSIGVPLISTLIAPVLVGLALQAIAPRWAARLAPIGSQLALIALVVLAVSTFGANRNELMSLVKTGVIVAGILLIFGAFAVGYLLARRERSAVLGLGTAQRNVAAAMVVASQDFTNTATLVMVTACALCGLIVLFPIAWLLSKRAPKIGLPTLRTPSA